MKMRIISLLLVLGVLLGFGGCKKNENNTSKPDSESTLVIYSANDEGTAVLKNLVKIYGKNITVKTAGKDYANTVKNEKTALFLVDAKEDLSGFYKEKLFADLGKDMKIPSGLNLSADGLGDYGIPLYMEAYGYIFDRDMLRDLFGEESVEKLVSALKKCSYTDFEGFVNAVDTYIATPSATAVTVDGEKFTFRAQKTGLAQKLTGVFALSAESTRASEYLLNYVLASKYAGGYNVMNADSETVGKMESAFGAALDVLDMHTSHIAGKEGSISRGDKFTAGDFTYSGAVDSFTAGYALFYPGSTTDTADFMKSNKDFGKNLDILPMKLPLSENDITASSMNVEKLNRSIVIGSRYYLVLGANADEKNTKAAKELVKWLFESQEGMKAYSSVYSANLPYNYKQMSTGENSSSETSTGSSSAPANSAKAAPAASSGTSSASTPATSSSGKPASSAGSSSAGTSSNTSSNAGQNAASYIPESSLAKAVAEYYNSGDWIPAMSTSLPSGWLQNSYGKSLADLWGKETWSEADRKKLVSGWLSDWKK